MDNITRLLITTSHGLYLCASRLLFPVWELPVMVVKESPVMIWQQKKESLFCNDMEIDKGVIVLQ